MEYQASLSKTGSTSTISRIISRECVIFRATGQYKQLAFECRILKADLRIYLRFPGSQPVSFDRTSLQLLEKEECVSCFSLVSLPRTTEEPNERYLARRQLLGMREIRRSEGLGVDCGYSGGTGGLPGECFARLAWAE